MANLDPLIRLHKHELDEKQKVLARLYLDVERLQRRKAGMLDQIEAERDLTVGDMDSMMIQAYLAYLQRAKRDIAIIDNEIMRIEARIEIVIEEMREAFGELKKIEITRDNRLAELAAENKRREDAIFAEIATTQHERNKRD